MAAGTEAPQLDEMTCKEVALPDGSIVVGQVGNVLGGTFRQDMR